MLGGAARSRLGERHRDGLATDDVRAAAVAALTASAGWASVDPQAVVAVLVGALQVTDEEDAAPLPLPALATAALALLVALAAGTPPEEHLALALAEVERAETVEAP